ncbi:MAG: hypothetical protein WAM14_05565 [Candidatus Nitrosopolaris sp.]
MSSESEQKGVSHVSNPFLNPMGLWQNYLINWIEMSRAYYENAIKVNEHWLKAFWNPWLRTTDVERKETAKVE